MSILLIFIIFLVAQFVPTVDTFLFGQTKLECKPCICHPECHCETKCVQQQLMKECNLGVDSHNAFASHYTQENRTTRLILLFSLIINFILTLLLLFRKPIRNCYRTQQMRKQQTLARQQTEHYAIALRQMIAPHAEQCLPQSNNLHTTSTQPPLHYSSLSPSSNGSMYTSPTSNYSTSYLPPVPALKF